MKYFIIFFLFFVTLYAQKPLNFVRQEVNWTKYEKLINSELRDSLITILQKTQEIEYPIEFNKFFHFLDIDNDGLLDIFFNSDVGAEVPLILVFQQNTNGFDKIFEQYGLIVDIEMPSKICFFQFQIYLPPCCAGTIEHFYDYVATNESGKINFVKINNFAFPYGLKFPEKYFENPIAFKTVNEQYKLRLEPIINDTTQYFIDTIGNTITIYPENSQGYALSEFLDETGRIWWFVIMKNNRKPIMNLIYPGFHDKKDYFTIGWMSSRFLKRI